MLRYFSFNSTCGQASPPMTARAVAEYRPDRLDWAKRSLAAGSSHDHNTPDSYTTSQIPGPKTTTNYQHISSQSDTDQAIHTHLQPSYSPSCSAQATAPLRQTLLPSTTQFPSTSRPSPSFALLPHQCHNTKVVPARTHMAIHISLQAQAARLLQTRTSAHTATSWQTQQPKLASKSDSKH